MREIGQFYFDRPEDALRVLALISEHDALKAAPPFPATRPTDLPTPELTGTGVLAAGETTRLLQAYGIPVARDATAATPEAAATAAPSIVIPLHVQARVPDL